MHKLRLTLAVLAIALMAVIVWKMWGTPDAAPPAEPAIGLTLPEDAAARTTTQLTPRQKLAATRRLILRRIAEAPDYEAFFARFQQSFPAAYTRTLAGFVDRAERLGRIESPDLYLAQALRSLRASHGVLAARASPALLERIFELQSTFIDVLSDADPKLCAGYLDGAASQAFYEFAARRRKLVAAIAQAGLEAIIEGDAQGVVREQVSLEDIGFIETQLREHGLERPEIDSLLDRVTPETPLADVTICRAAQVYYKVLRNAPDELRMKVYAQMLQERARY